MPLLRTPDSGGIRSPLPHHVHCHQHHTEQTATSTKTRLTLPAAPPRRLTPTAKSRQRRVWFQHRITSSMLSCRAPQYFTSVGYQLQPQTCTPFTPHPHHTTRPRRLTATAKSRQRRVWFQHHVNSSITFCRFSRKRHARTRSVADSGNCTRLVL
jgi:hypothetical protein